jgi:1-acyl-sn-glycerol-3-phosphate acyltransferase
MKTFFTWSYFILYLIITMFKTIKLEFIKKYKSHQEAEKYVDKVVRNWGKSVVNTVGAKVEVLGTENIPVENCLFVSNHQSNLDIPVLVSTLNKPIGFIAKKEMEKLPIVSYWMRQMRCIFMDRENIRESIKSINQGAEYLREGYSMVIFPEGTRSKSSKIGEFKKGSTKLGIKAEVPIVPVTINGTYKCLEGNNNKFYGDDVKIVIHKPIYIHDLNKEEQGNLAESIKNIVEEGMSM